MFDLLVDMETLEYISGFNMVTLSNNLTTWMWKNKKGLRLPRYPLICGNLDPLDYEVWNSMRRNVNLRYGFPEEFLRYESYIKHLSDKILDGIARILPLADGNPSIQYERGIICDLYIIDAVESFLEFGYLLKYDESWRRHDDFLLWECETKPDSGGVRECILKT